MAFNEEWIATLRNDMDAVNAIHARIQGKTLVLDHALGWAVPFPTWQSAETANLLARARAWSQGLAAIASRISLAEADAVNATSGEPISCWAVVPGISMERRLEIQCDFDSFAVMAACYTRVVAALAIRHGVVEFPATKNYSAGILGGALWYRHKVAAHLAAATNHNDDSEVERLMSAATRLTFRSGRISIGGESLTIAGGSHSSESSEWSVTDTFAHLSARYWPKTDFEDTSVSLCDLPPTMGVVIPAGNFSFLKFDMHQTKST